MQFPKEALSQHIGVLGKTGSGKSSVMRAIVESVLNDDQPVCIIDPKGDWYGLRSAANGKDPGFPVVIFGGEHADVPIDEHSAKEVAKLIATGNRPCIIDLGGWRVGARSRFFIEFAATLFKRTKGKRYLVIDEVHNFAPQGKVMSVESGEMLHWANRLASEGRGKGLNIICASQRPQKVHKDFLTCCETLIAMRVIHQLDRKSIKDWIDGCPDPEKGKEVLKSLATIKRGQGWVWSPEIDFGPKLIKFKMFKTFDSFAPQTDENFKLEGWASVDLDEVKNSLSAEIEEAEARNPAKLQEKITDLENKLKESQAATKIVEIPILTDEDRALLRQAIKTVENINKKLGFGEIKHTGNYTLAADAVKTEKKPTAKQVPAPKLDMKLGKCERKILETLAIYGPCNKSRLTLLSGYRFSGAFQNSLRTLRLNSCIEGSNSEIMSITDNGLPLVLPIQGIPKSKSAMRVFWKSKFGKCERAILDALFEHPDGLSAKQLCNITNYSYSGAFQNALRNLRVAGILIGKNTETMKASEYLV